MVRTWRKTGELALKVVRSYESRDSLVGAKDEEHVVWMRSSDHALGRGRPTVPTGHVVWCTYVGDAFTL